MQDLCRASFDITEADVVAVTLRVWRSSPVIEETYRRNWRNGIIAGVFVAGSMGSVAYFSSSDPKRALGIAATVVLFWVIVWPIYAARHLTRKAFNRKMDEAAERLVRERKIPVTLGPCEILLYPDQVMIIEKEDQIAKPWTAASRVVQEDDGVYIEFTNQLLLRIPTRAFASPGDRTRFIQVAQKLVADALHQ
jgi:hypothetical protein